MPDRGYVPAALVCPPRPERAVEQAATRRHVLGSYFVTRARIPAFLAHRHASTTRLRSADRRVDHPAPRVGNAPDERAVLARNPPITQLLHQRGVRASRTGD